MIGFYDIWPFFAVVTVCLAIASTSFFANFIPDVPAHRRISALDGLRGFLALGVLFYHLSIQHQYNIDGTWLTPPSQFYNILGQSTVEIFFMITGFLFWNQVIFNKGQMDWTSLFVGRIFRIGPLYLFAIFVMFLLVLISSKYTLQVNRIQLIGQLLQWSALGLFGVGPNINNDAETFHLLFGVTWTLRLEWFFYFSLIVTAYIVRRTRFELLFTAFLFSVSCLVAILFGIFSPVGIRTACSLQLFSTGMLCASLRYHFPDMRIRSHVVESLLCIGLISSVFVLFWSSYAFFPMLLLGCAFYLVVSGCNLFGLLVLKSAQRLGAVSFGVYLLQGLIVNFIYEFESVANNTKINPIVHWLSGSISAILLIFVAAVSHRLIEQNGIIIGRNIVRKFRSRKSDYLQNKIFDTRA